MLDGIVRAYISHDRNPGFMDEEWCTLTDPWPVGEMRGLSLSLGGTIIDRFDGVWTDEMTYDDEEWFHEVLVGVAKVAHKSPYKEIIDLTQELPHLQEAASRVGESRRAITDPRPRGRSKTWWRNRARRANGDARRRVPSRELPL